MADKRTEEKRPFAGESCIETGYCLTFDEVMEGFSAVESVKKNPQRIVGAAVLMLCAVMLLPTLGSSIALFGLTMEAIVCYLLFRVWYLPLLRRRKVARSIAQRQMRYVIRLYESGVQVEEREHRYNLSYRNLTLYDAAPCLILVAEGQMIIVPKHYWGERLEPARQRLREKLGERYVLITKKFRGYPAQR